MAATVPSPDAIGFIGVGHIAAAVVNTLAAAPLKAERIVLSPRGHEQAAALSARHPEVVTVAASNQAVLDAVETVFLCVRPQVAAEVLAPLTFAPHHRVVSLISLPMAELQPLTHPAVETIRVLVLPTCVQRVQAVPYWPSTPWAESTIARLGPPLLLPDERGLAVLWASTAMIASVLEVIGTIAGWSVAQGVPERIAADYAATMVHGVTGQVAAGDPDRFTRLAVAAATPGGLNEQVVKTLRQASVFQNIATALDAILHRISPGSVDSAKPHIR